MTGDCDSQSFSGRECVSSRNYPQVHGVNEACTVNVIKDAQVLPGDVFQIETGYDILQVAATNVRCKNDFRTSVASGDIISCVSDYSEV